jgi:hypothetical protein
MNFSHPVEPAEVALGVADDDDGVGDLLGFARPILDRATGLGVLAVDVFVDPD